LRGIPCAGDHVTNPRAAASVAFERSPRYRQGRWQAVCSVRGVIFTGGVPDLNPPHLFVAVQISEKTRSRAAKCITCLEKARLVEHGAKLGGCRATTLLSPTTASLVRLLTAAL
jgi:hypothetical protein